MQLSEVLHLKLSAVFVGYKTLIIKRCEWVFYDEWQN